MSQNKIRDYEKLAHQIFDLVGGQDNIVKVSRCITRLRLILKEVKPEMKKEITQLPGVITVIESSGQFQIVIGQHVSDLYPYFLNLVNLSAHNHKEPVLNRIILAISGILTPFIYILAAAGILQGLLIIIRVTCNTFFPEINIATATYRVFDLISWAPFYFLPILIAVTASNHFKTNVFIALSCCAALVSPSLVELTELIKGGESLKLWILPLSEITYNSSVLPPIFLVWLLSYLEPWLDKKLPAVVRPTFTPLICLVLMVPFTLTVIGPITSHLAHSIAEGYNWLVNVVPYIAGTIIGMFWQVLVIFGVHHSLTPMILANFENYGADSFQAFQSLAVMAQVGAVFGVYLKSRQTATKSIAMSAFITGLFGITEPAIYGINLRFKQPFIIGCISAGIAGLIASFMHPYYYAFAGLPGPLTLFNSLNEANTSSFFGVLIGSIIAFLLPVLLIKILWRESADEQSDTQADLSPSSTEEIAAVETTPSEVTGLSATSMMIASPMNGALIPIEEVDDEVFSQKMLGDGIAIVPEDNTVYAPADGVIQILFDDSKHAIGLLSNEGVEILIHVGFNTVNLKEGQFSYHVNLKQHVKLGDPLLSFDREAVEQAGCCVITPIVITNSDQFSEITFTQHSIVQVTESLITIKR